MNGLKRYQWAHKQLSFHMSIKVPNNISLCGLTNSTPNQAAGNGRKTEMSEGKGGYSSERQTCTFCGRPEYWYCTDNYQLFTTFLVLSSLIQIFVMLQDFLIVCQHSDEDEVPHLWHEKLSLFLKSTENQRIKETKSKAYRRELVAKCLYILLQKKKKSGPLESRDSYSLIKSLNTYK